GGGDDRQQRQQPPLVGVDGVPDLGGQGPPRGAYLPPVAIAGQADLCGVQGREQGGEGHSTHTSSPPSSCLPGGVSAGPPAPGPGGGFGFWGFWGALSSTPSIGPVSRGAPPKPPAVSPNTSPRVDVASPTSAVTSPLAPETPKPPKPAGAQCVATVG